ncbi:hypothetical protein V8F20_007312 [Naviculisporaceae sp. PSN 640]
MLFPSTIATLSATLAVFISTTGAAPAPVSLAGDNTPAKSNIKAREWLSNIDVQAACQEQHWLPADAKTVGSTCWDWKCAVLSPGGLINIEFGVDMDKYCKTHHGDGARAECGGGGVYDWQCRN